MAFRKIAFLMLFLCCLYNVQGQTNFVPGYVITNGNDTLHGLVDYRSDQRNSRKCEFKENKNAPPQEFLPFSIKGYRFNDSKFYVSKNVLVEGKEMPLFLEYMVDGISDLYFYSDGQFFHYYIEKKEGQLYELTNEKQNYELNGSHYITNSNKYIGVLKLAFADCPELMPKINAASLDDKSLVALTKEYHAYVCEDEKCISYEKSLPSIKVTVGAFVSMNSSFMKFGNTSRYETVDFKMTGFPTIGLLLNTSIPRASEKLSIQISGEYGKAYFYGTGIKPDNQAFEEVYLHLSVLKIKAGIKYTYPKGTFRPTVLVGAHRTSHFQTDGRTVEEIPSNSTISTFERRDIPLAKVLLGYHIEAGIDYHSTATLVPFIRLSYEKSKGNLKFLIDRTPSTNINTINIHAGIYF